MSNFEEIGTAFVKHYYQVFDSDRSQLVHLYQDESMLSFEGDQIQGAEKIVEKLQGLRLGQVAHQISSLDCQPSVSGGVIVFVCGQLVADGEEERPMAFSQIFHLMPADAGGNNFYVTNDMFRLNLS
eukprot:gb/GECH01003299.1/.p1 GENE.gb/GECH01003299.1/~~gb/GECH01003299.1/.p1  ORF type:complete len:127 (+),score=37.46 gb/GECH01003299.1/:1-381(+)